MSERIPDTIWDFFNTMKQELMAVVNESERRALVRHQELLTAIRGEEQMDIPLPDVLPVPVESNDQTTGKEAPVGITRYEKDHIETHKTFRMSCEYCRKEKYGT